MEIFEELKKRGLIAQVTDEEEIKQLINNGGARFYIVCMSGILWLCAL